MKTKYVIFDLDNCLADDRERIPLIDWTQEDPDKRYAAYHAACEEDRVGNYDTFQAHTESMHRRPIFMTARPTSIEEQTKRWITTNLGVSNCILMMRNVGDRRRSVDVKREMLTHLAHWDIEVEDVIVALDDHPDIVQMYKDCGLSAHELRIHDLDAYTPPSRVAPEESAAIAGITVDEGDSGELLREEPELDMGRDIPLQRRSPDSLLRLAAETYEDRTRTYGTLYKDVGSMYAVFFPAGLTLRSPEDFTRFSVLNHVVNKVARYARSMEEGGHPDSAHDLMVYAAMLREVTE